MVSFSSPNYLVVGASGVIGSALFAQLQARQQSVLGTTYKLSSVPSPNLFYLNLSEPPTSWQFPKINFDVVYLCAGVCRMALCENDPLATRLINVEHMKALIEYYSAKNAFIIYLSTNQVFAGREPNMQAHAPPDPQNEYGAQKASVEMWLSQTRKQFAIVRLTKVMDPGLYLIQQWLTAFAQHQPIDAFYDMMLAPVTLQQVINILINIGEKKQTGYFQVSGATDISYYDFAIYFAKQLHQSPSLVRAVSAREKGIKKNFLPLFTTLDCSSTIALCGEVPPLFSEVADNYMEK